MAAAAALGSRAVLSAPKTNANLRPSSVAPASASRGSLAVRAASVRVEFTPAAGGEAIVSTIEVSSVLREVALADKVELYGMA
jgi:hypothetical protein